MKTTFLQYGLKIAKNLRDEGILSGNFQQIEFITMI